MAPYTLRVDGKYDIARWEDGWSLALHWEMWSFGVLRLGDSIHFVDKWLKVYKGKKLVCRWLVPKGAAARREQLSTRMGRCCHP